MLVRLDGSLITGWDAFHDVFAEKFGFPGFYGRNMDAWIDCMSYLDDPNAGMTSVHAPSGMSLTLQIDNVDAFATRCPEIFEAMVDCAASVNWRRIERSESPLLALAFYKTARLFADDAG